MILAPTLTLSAGSGAAIVRPTFSRDFAGEKTLNNGTGPAITFTRASNATFFDANGVLQTASNDQPRFDHSSTGSSLGLLIEEARTNSIRNSQAGGSTNGVIGSGGALPTNWAGAGVGDSFALAGLAVEVVGTGTAQGLHYIDIKISGTPSITTDGVFYPDSNISASSGQTWTNSAHVAVVGGTTANVTPKLTLLTRNGANGIPQRQDSNISLSSSLTRFNQTFSITDATVVRIQPCVGFNWMAGNPIDLTLRIAAPQLEQGAFPTSYIPTTTAAATRSADSAVVTPISSFYNQSEGTVFAEYIFPSTIPSSGFPHVYSFSDGGSDADNIRLIGTATTNPFISRVGGTDQCNIGPSAVVAGTIYRNAGAYRQDDFAASRNGGAAITDTSGSVPSGMTQLRLGAAGSTANRFTGYLRKIAYYPRRLSNTLLQQLTT